MFAPKLTRFALLFLIAASFIAGKKSKGDPATDKLQGTRWKVTEVTSAGTTSNPVNLAADIIYGHLPI